MTTRVLATTNFTIGAYRKIPARPIRVEFCQVTFATRDQNYFCVKINGTIRHQGVSRSYVRGCYRKTVGGHKKIATLVDYKSA